MSDFTLTEEMLADGRILDLAVANFLEDKTKEKLAKALIILRSSKVWIPCKISMSDRDQAKMDAIVNRATNNMGNSGNAQFENKDEIRYVPELITNGDGYFMPIFSNEKYMEKYGAGVVKLNRSILDVIDVAQKNKVDLKGLVLNPFNESFIITKEIWPTILKIEPIIKE